MKKFFSAPVLVIVFLSFIVSNCNRRISDSTARITPPFENLNVAFTEHEVNSDSGGEIKLENGTRIKIPPQAFVNANGEPVKSNVKILYREFYNSADILLSGIPMKYGEEDFQTAGMFEIKAKTSDNVNVELADGKNVVVQMASYVNGEEYKFYYFDETTGKWDYRGEAPPQENENKKLAMESLPVVGQEPIEPVKQRNNSQVFDLDVNLSLYPELSNFNGVVWQYAGKDKNENPENSPWVFTEKWSYVKLDKIDESELNYTLYLQNNSKKYQTTVTPVLNGKYYNEALKRFKKLETEYSTALQVRQDAEARIGREADLLRTFSINNFGIYNWDCFMKKDQNIITLNADFKIDQKISGFRTSDMTIYLVTGNSRAVVMYPPGSWSNFVFNPTDVNKLIAVLPGNRIAVFSSEDFKSLASDSGIKNRSNYNFTLKVMDEQVVTKENLEQVLSSI